MKKNMVCLGLIVLISTTINAQFWKTGEVLKLGGEVNSSAEESSPVFGDELSKLYFTRTFDKKNKGGVNDQDIWYAIRNENGDYTNAQNLTALNNKLNNAVVGLSSDGKRLYLLEAYEGKKDFKKGLAFSERDDKGNWGKPKKVDIPDLDIDGNFYGFYISRDENIIIISYEGPNSLGKEDLYLCEKTNGKWSSPRHMGNVINSSGFEMSPFLTPTMDTLYFSSDGFGGYGDADIFYSVKKGGWTSWSEPVNLGERINSPQFDAYFSYSGKYAYLSSNRDATKENSYSNIYRFEILTPPSLLIACSGTNVSTFNGTDGSAKVEITDGVPPYSYEWNNSATTESVSGLKAGDYSVIVTDAIGQTANCVVTLNEPEALADIFFKHFFDYNANQLSIEDEDLNNFVQQVKNMISNGKEQVTILINSSASQVRTLTFGTNQKLAETRAFNMKKGLENYFNEAGLKDKVVVKVNNVMVAGPNYTGDFDNTDKYRPYQYIELKTK